MGHRVVYCPQNGCGMYNGTVTPVKFNCKVALCGKERHGWDKYCRTCFTCYSCGRMIKKVVKLSSANG